MHEKFILTTHHISVKTKNKQIFTDVCISLPKGQIIGLLGPNGAGKTTLFHTIIGAIRPNEGKIFFEDQEITHLPLFKRSNLGIGYLTQEPSIFRNLTVEENLLAYLETTNLNRKERKLALEESLSQLGLESLAKKKTHLLSGGEKRRTEIARALIKNPRLILLDEPFANIDPITIYDVKNLVLMLKERGITTLITDHNAREIFSLVDTCYILHNQSILASGLPKALLEDPIVQDSYLGAGFSS